jgi:hypothetical protein
VSVLLTPGLRAPSETASSIREDCVAARRVASPRDASQRSTPPRISTQLNVQFNLGDKQCRKFLPSKSKA